ncbi:MAG TPA: NAD(P)-dependent oxidoreductase [Vicinamibacterales bacterium]|jgi:3-hydroxyisobutyrate dehydrogenase-like beta-hydroxyacid dehydrogenase|nr:NAD(P)-dependent oxidoreductase [Vicinamibacterales bacterium]
MRIGFIGLGTMGGRMATSLRNAGHEMYVNDIRPEAVAPHVAAGACALPTARDVGAAADIVFTSLPGPAEFTDVAVGANGLLHGMSRGSVLFDLTTNSPTTIRNIHATFADAGLHLLDAPVSGGPKGAETRSLAIWVGGEQDVYTRYEKLLRDIGDQPSYIGPVGVASVAKLVHNCAGYTIQAALAEVFTMGVKGGVDPLVLWRICRQGFVGRARVFDRLADQFLPATFDPPNFRLHLAHKDVSLATALARELNVPMRLSNLALEELTEAVNRGWSERDSRVAMLLQEERAGVQIKVSPERIREALRQDG